MILAALVYVGGALGICFITLCLASGLYYLAEFVEEYSSLAKKIISSTVYFAMAVHFLLLFEGLPVWRLAFSFICQVIYRALLTNFPLIQVSDPLFISSCILVIANHFQWFWYFTAVRAYYFSHIAAHFFFSVWLTPFMLFISLSAADNVLPDYDPASREATRGKFGNVVKSTIGWLFSKKDLLLPSKGASKTF